ncbi:MAG: lactate utilization protein [Thermodesulfobacteriota bacterium]|nr:lactate utilization protein [Thermodesulfobacteriota bacterium]
MDNYKANFIEKAELVSAFLYEVKTMEDAFLQAIALCEKKQPCQSLYSTGDKVESYGARTLPSNKTIAAPGLSPDMFNNFKLLCKNKGIDLVKSDLRKYPGGMDMGFTIADFGIAETGTLVINSDNEDTRLATMLSEVHVALLKESNIRTTALDMAEELKELTAKPSSYTAFITGASRTADIERVLALGVHGPLELHIILLGE